MAASLQISWTTIREAIGMMSPWSRNPSDWTTDQSNDAARIIRSGLTKAYNPPVLAGDKESHRWSFLRPEISLTTSAPYSTGTVTIVAGVATLAGGTFPTWAASGWMYIGGVPYYVSTRDGNTQLTLVDTSVAKPAGTAYELRRIRYPITVPTGTNFGGLAGTLYYLPGQSLKSRSLSKVSADRIMHRYQQAYFSNGEDYPTEYALVTDNYAPTTGQSWSILLWPAANAAYYVHGMCHVVPYDLDGTNLYPAGGALHGQMVLEAILSEAELALFDAYGEHQQKFLSALATSIAIDKGMSSPDSLGTIPGGIGGLEGGYAIDQGPVGDFWLVHEGFEDQILP